MFSPRACHRARPAASTLLPAPPLVTSALSLIHLQFRCSDSRPVSKSLMFWTRQAVGQQHNNNKLSLSLNTPAPYVLEVRRAVAQLLLVNRAGRGLLHLSMWFPNPPTERDGSSLLPSHDDPLCKPGHRRRSLMFSVFLRSATTFQRISESLRTQRHSLSLRPSFHFPSPWVRQRWHRAGW